MGIIEIFTLMVSLIGTLVGAGAAASANEQNQQNFERSQQFAIESAGTANATTKEHYETLYSPQAKVQQYKDAGLNPALMYMQGGGSVGSTAAQAATPTAPTIDPLVSGDWANKMFENVLTAAQTKKTNAEESNINEDTKLKTQQIQNLQKTIEVQDKEIKKIESEINVNLATEAILKVDKRLKDIEENFQTMTFVERITAFSENINLIIEQKNNLKEDTEIKKIEKDKRDKYLESAIKEMNARAALEWAQKGKAEADKLLVESEKILTDEQCKLTDAQKAQAWQTIWKIKTEMKNIEQDTSLKKAQTAKTYVNIGTDCVNSIANVATNITTLGGIMKNSGNPAFTSTTK